MDKLLQVIGLAFLLAFIGYFAVYVPLNTLSTYRTENHKLKKELQASQQRAEEVFTTFKEALEVHLNKEQRDAIYSDKDFFIVTDSEIHIK